MKLSVIILNWNGSKLMEEFLPSVIAHTPADVAEVVVADNGSTDASISILEDRFPAVRLIRLDRNYGFAEGYNKALEHTEAEYTVMLNSDVEVTPGWIDAPLAIMEGDAGVAAVQPKIRSQRRRSHFEYAGAAGGYIDLYGYPYCRGRMLSIVEEDRGQYDDVADIFWASGACLFIRTKVYKQEGGLDATFFAHQEEIDLCWRLRARGYRIVYTPQSVVFHVGGATLNVESPHKTFLNFRNNLLMLYKNIPASELRPALLIRFLLDMLAAVRFLLSGHPSNMLAVIRAMRAFLRMKPTYKPIRLDNLNKTTNHPIPEISRRSLLVSFYLKGKHTYA